MNSNGKRKGAIRLFTNAALQQKKTPSQKKAVIVMKGMKKKSASNNIAYDTAKMAMKHFSIPGKHLALSLWPLKKNDEGKTHYRGEKLFYPASIIKLHYMAAAFAWFEERKIKQTAEITRALSNMIRISSNDATNFLIDVLTKTESGPELSMAELCKWVEKRRAINRWFLAQNWPEYKSFNATQKTWEEGPYGREYQSRMDIPHNRNVLSTEMVARLLYQLYYKKLVSKKASMKMMGLMRRNLTNVAQKNDPDYQIKGFFGEGLPKDTILMSKAGWTSQTRHDAAIILPKQGNPFILVAFTDSVKTAADEKIMPFIAKHAFRLMR